MYDIIYNGTSSEQSSDESHDSQEWMFEDDSAYVFLDDNKEADCVVPEVCPTKNPIENALSEKDSMQVVPQCS